MRERNDMGQFVDGHSPCGGFKKGSKHTEIAKQKISESLKNKTGADSRRWKGNDASYVAKHMWIKKHFGEPNRCENPDCSFENPKRYEWANISGEHKRERRDYVMLCPSCHRRADLNGGVKLCLGL